MLVEVQNWARYPRSRSTVLPVTTVGQEIPFGRMSESFLAFGMGRSLSDVCLNDGNVLLSVRGMNRVIAWDPLTGRLVAEAGLTLDAVLQFAVRDGWFPQVTPGTRFVTLGGALANDVHGKNHHVRGAFGNHVVRFQLRRSDGERLLCSADENPEWFRATIGGLGLTGLVEWMEIQLQPILNSWMESETIRYGDVDEFFALDRESVERYEYVVAWVDTLSRGRCGRGLFIRGNHSADAGLTERTAPGPAKVSVPFIPPVSLLNSMTLKGFNSAYYRLRPAVKQAVAPLGPFFYPLDAIGEYHRAYGPSGMLQWQGLIGDREAVREVLSEASRMGGSFLTVMKVMGAEPSRGLLSFSGAGTTLALDFPFSERVMKLLPRLDEIVAEAGGRLYPAKDARMSGEIYRRMYPQWTEMLRFIDPKFSSSFWRRVMAA